MHPDCLEGLGKKRKDDVTTITDYKEQNKLSVHDVNFPIVVTNGTTKAIIVENLRGYTKVSLDTDINLAGCAVYYDTLDELEKELNNGHYEIRRANIDILE